jgi:hypothetical protein
MANEAGGKIVLDPKRVALREAATKFSLAAVDRADQKRPSKYTNARSMSFALAAIKPTLTSSRMKTF